jgi:DNA repair protein RadA/Sms
MASKQQYQCTECKEVFAKWGGQCPNCKKWNTMVDYDPPISITTTGTSKGIRAAKAATGNKARPVSEIGKEIQGRERLSTGISEFDRVLGGGLVAGGVILLAGEPGIGKSSCALAAASAVAKQGKKVLYITGEETVEQVASRAVRIGATDGQGKLGESLYLLSEGNLQNAIQELVDIQPDFLIVDSIQTLLSNDSESRIGSVTQVNEVATDFNNIAKRMGIPAILIGHVTKDGQIAGPRVVEHLVDVVLFFEANNDSPLRMLRANKNRYGATDEIGCFEHTSEGLMPVDDPSGYFTSPHAEGTTGFATSITLEGIRALPIELQALVAKTKLPNPRKITQGIEHGRALQMQAVLDRYIGLQLDSQDVYVATTGGLRLKDTSTDLAAIAAIVSSAQDIAIPVESVFIGEVSLTGEIRASRERQKRCQEADRLGFTTIYTTPSDKKLNVKAKVIEISSVLELCTLLKEMKTSQKRY